MKAATLTTMAVVALLGMCTAQDETPIPTMAPTKFPSLAPTPSPTSFPTITPLPTMTKPEEPKPAKEKKCFPEGESCFFAEACCDGFKCARAEEGYWFACLPCAMANEPCSKSQDCCRKLHCEIAEGQTTGACKRRSEK